MKVFCHNFNPKSNSGPNKFTRQLMNRLFQKGKISLSESQQDADVEFALIQMSREKRKPLILRLDGIYFNTAQNFKEQNRPIQYAYENSDCVIFQSNFNRQLTEKWFGKHPNSHVIHNGADTNFIQSVGKESWDKVIDKDKKVWSCAASWRPHKRLEENLRYFCEFADKDTVMVVAGRDPDIPTFKKYANISNGRVLYAGELGYSELVSLYKRSEKFVHLAFLDHCPNVVVDAQAAGCEIVCSSTGGTREIVKNGKVIVEKIWDFNPLELYSPPSMDFTNHFKLNSSDSSYDLDTASQMYFDKMSDILL